MMIEMAVPVYAPGLPVLKMWEIQKNRASCDENME